MKSKFLLFVMTVLGLCSIFSVGFASWVLTKPMDSYNKEDAVNTIVYEAYNNVEFIDINNFTTLQYYNTGFIKDGVNVTDTGSITIDFTLHVKAYKDYLKEQEFTDEQIQNTGIVIELMLKHAADNNGLNFFNSALFNFKYKVDGLTGEGTTGNGSAATIKLVTLPGDDTVNFSITFDITYTGNIGADFKTNVFNNIKGKNIRFAMEAKITKIE